MNLGTTATLLPVAKPKITQTPTVPKTTTTTTTTGSTGSWLDKILGVAEKGADIYSTVTGSGSSQSPNLPSNITINTPGGTPPAEDNTMKYVLIGGGVLAAAGIIYAVSRKKKK